MVAAMKAMKTKAAKAAKRVVATKKSIKTKRVPMKKKGLSTWVHPIIEESERRVAVLLHYGDFTAIVNVFSQAAGGTLNAAHWTPTEELAQWPLADLRQPVAWYWQAPVWAIIE